jgi:hypothetical protein
MVAIPPTTVTVCPRVLMAEPRLRCADRDEDESETDANEAKGRLRDGERDRLPGTNPDRDAEDEHHRPEDDPAQMIHPVSSRASPCSFSR